MKLRIVNIVTIVGLWLFQVSTAQEKDPFLSGKVWFEAERYDSAVHYMNIELEQDKKHEEAYYYRGISYLMMDQQDKAIEDLMKTPFNLRSESYFWLAKAYAKKGEVSLVIENLEKNLRSPDKVPESKIFLDPDFDKLNENRQWVEFWKSNTFYYGLDQELSEAEYLIKTGKYLDAVDLLSSTLKKNYRKAPIYAKRARAYIYLDNKDLALNDLDRALDSDSRNSDLYQQRGIIYYEQGRYKKALEDFEQALRYEEDNLKNLTWLALAQQRNGLYETALETMNTYLSYYPEDHNGWYQFGKLHMNEGKYLSAIRSFNRSLALTDTVAAYHLGRGEAYFNTRTWRNANNDLAMSLDLDPYNPDAYFIKAKVALKLGDRDHACFCFRQAYKYGKNEAFNYLNDLCRNERQ